MSCVRSVLNTHPSIPLISPTCAVETRKVKVHTPLPSCFCIPSKCYIGRKDEAHLELIGFKYGWVLPVGAVRVEAGFLCRQLRSRAIAVWRAKRRACRQKAAALQRAGARSGEQGEKVAGSPPCGGGGGPSEKAFRLMQVAPQNQLLLLF